MTVGLRYWDMQIFDYLVLRPDMISYDKQTINTPNPIARFAHRNRLAKVLRLASSQKVPSRVLDYGCGSGSFIANLSSHDGIEACGYEPYMTERVSSNLNIYDSFEAASSCGPYNLITLFETIEHLSQSELDEFLRRADSCLAPDGKVLISAPIEIGPALLLKEMNRCLLFRRPPEHGFVELILAALFGITASRAPDIKVSHKGFDFRKVVIYLEKAFGPVNIDSYGPLPVGTWFGNSQVYFWLTRSSILG